MKDQSFMRIHPLWLLIELIKVIRNVIALYAFLYFSSKYINLIGMFRVYIVSVVFIYSTFSLLLYWKNFKFRINKKQLEIQKGKLFSTISYIPIDSITGYSEHYNLIEKVFNLSSITVKLQSTDEERDMKIPVIDQNKALIIKKNIDGFINEKHENTTREQRMPFFSLSKSQLMKGSISSISIIVFLIFLYSLYEKVNEYKNIDIWINFIKEKGQENNIYMILIILGLLILSLLYAIIKTLLKYGNFKLHLEKDKIHTSWGIFPKINNTINKKYISAIIIKSSLLQQLFKIENIEVINMDSDKENVKPNTLTPFIEREKTLSYINDVLEWDINGNNFYKIPIKSIMPKLIRSSFIWLSCLILSFFFDKTWYLYIFFLIYILLSQLLQIFLSGFLYSKDQIIFLNRGIKKEKTIISYSKINELKISQSYIQSYLDLYSIEVIIKASPIYKVKLQDISKKHIENIRQQFQK